MLRSSLVAASAVLLCSAASAQQQLQAKKVLGPVKNAGTYHVATGTWTRGGQQSNISPDYIYRNDVGSGYFGTGWEGCWTVDEIILPGTGSPKGGPQDAYQVDGFDFSYCSLGASVDFYFNYYNSYVPCDDPSSPANCIDENSTAFLVAGLPAGGGCWIVTLDLAGGYEVCIDADGGSCAPGYDGGGLGLDHAGLGFGWDAGGATTGPFLNGDPTWVTPGAYTCYDTTSTTCNAQATGLGAQDLFSISNYDLGGGYPGTCGLGNGCYFFGGYNNLNGCGAASNTPIGQFGINLFADCTVTCSGGAPFTEYCDETQNSNNYGNISVNSNSLGGPDIVVSMTNGVQGQSAYLLVSAGSNTVSAPPGAKGDLCVAGATIGRYVKDIQSMGAGGTATTNLNTNLTTGTGYKLPAAIGGVYTAGATWNFQYWHRQPMGAPSTFSSAASVTFQN